MKLSLRQKKISNNRISLYLEIYENGKKQYDFLKLYLEPVKRGDKITMQKNKDTLTLAKKILAERQDILANDINGFVSKKKSTLDFIKYFFNFSQSKTGNTKNTYLQTLEYIRRFNKADILEIGLIDSQWIENFIIFLKKQERLSINTVWLYLTKVKTCINQAYKQGLILRNPLEKAETTIKRKKTQRNFLTFDEIAKIIKIETKYPNEKQAFLLSCFTGLRYSDLCNLKWKNISDDYISIEQQKTKEPLSLDLTKPAKQILATIEKTGDKVFKKLRLNSHINLIVKELVSKAQIDKLITFHCGRHSFACNYISLGGDIYVLKEMLGHSDIATTAIYAKVVNERKKQAAALFPEIEL